MLAAVGFRAPDRIPLQIFPAAGGLHEHGTKLLDLMRACGHDFGDLSALGLPEAPARCDYDPDGRYHAIKTDEWGTTWEFRIFGVWGHPIAWPLEDMSRLDAYRFPDPPNCDGAAFAQGVVNAARHRERYFQLDWGGSTFEKMHSLRRFEDVLMDIALDTPEINRLADRLIEYSSHWVRRALLLGADAIAYGDDYGTQQACIVSPECWRRFFKPRLKSLFEPAVRAGKPIFFHSCGQIWPLLEDLREIGVGAIWPQLTAYDMAELAGQCRRLGLAVQLHPDRGDLMQRGTRTQVRDYVHRMLDTFGTADGGSWLYIEVDPGFRWECVEALFEVAAELRR